MRQRGAAKSQGEGSQIAGRLALLGFMVLFSLSLIAASGATIALADSPVPTPPLTLPGDAGISGRDSATTGPCPSCRTWIVAGRPGTRTARIAARYGARPVAPGLGIFRTLRERATGFAAALRQDGLLAWAEPDVPIRSAAYPDDLLAAKQTWLDQIVNPAETTPPTVAAGSPLIGMIEQGMDPTHGDLLQADLTGATPTGDVILDSHGTTIAGIIGSPGEGKGIRGTWPGARMEHFPAGGVCSTAAAAVMNAARAGASVINMSYSIPAPGCYSHYLAIQYAVSRDVLPVAAAGNDAEKGNPALGPATFPHVVAVAAVDQANLVAPFSTHNPGVDISAPGVDVWAPVTKLGEPDSEGTTPLLHTWAAVSGTSFSAPMVTAAAAWIRQIHPDYTAYQAAQVLTGSATDLGAPGRDPFYGTGLLDIDAALIAPTPAGDPMEPNDDIPLLRGQGEIPKAKYLWRHGQVRIRAGLSRAKDPSDVYRVRIPARRTILVTVAQLEGDVRLTALKPSARSLDATKGKVIVKTDKAYPRTEGIKVRNLRRKPGDIWLVVTPGPRQNTDSSAYRLTIRRTR